jgi:KaiC/GvpD/RAD55 family RecA-like ATPase
MKTKLSSASRLPKALTGIEGFDEITNGGLPRGRTTLLEGGPGSGKTIFAINFLVHGARECKEPGVFVAFEEHSQRVIANAHGFGWKLAELQPEKLFFLDAQPTPDLIQSGNFDLSGMLEWELDALSSMPLMSSWRFFRIARANGGSSIGCMNGYWLAG